VYGREYLISKRENDATKWHRRREKERGKERRKV